MAIVRLKTEREVAKFKSPGRYSVGGNIVLQIGKNGSGSWIARITDHLGRRRDIGLGSRRDITLGLARERVRLARSAIAQACDPVEALHPTPMPTFKELARQFHAEREGTYKNAKQWITSLETYAFPHIGPLPVNEVQSFHVKAALQPIWLKKEETARRVLQRIAAVIAYAVPSGFRVSVVRTFGTEGCVN